MAYLSLGVRVVLRLLSKVPGSILVGLGLCMGCHYTEVQKHSLGSHHQEHPSCERNLHARTLMQTALMQQTSLTLLSQPSSSQAPYPAHSLGASFSSAYDQLSALAFDPCPLRHHIRHRLLAAHMYQMSPFLFVGALCLFFFSSDGGGNIVCFFFFRFIFVLGRGGGNCSVT